MLQVYMWYFLYFHTHLLNDSQWYMSYPFEHKCVCSTSTDGLYVWDKYVGKIKTMQDISGLLSPQRRYLVQL